MKLPVLGAALLIASALPARGETVEERLAQFGAAARARLAPSFARAAVPYPPRRVVLAGFKTEQRLELYAPTARGELRFVRLYPVLAASGTWGPKLREGDQQVPEGFYRVSALNPNSRYHVSLRVDYPNAEDRRRAADENRGSLGGDIMIHGGAESVGCLAVGDPAAEELFTLAADTGIAGVRVILSPLDFRRRRLPPLLVHPRPWVPALYDRLRAEIATLP